MGFFKTISQPFFSLRKHVFARFYFAQTISLLGDAVTWVGIALLAYQFGPDRSATILSTALTLRVTAFILFSPVAGVWADRANRKMILYGTHFMRMVIVGCLPFVQSEWQVYGLIFLLNVFNAFFTPTYRAVIAQVLKGEYYREGIALSSATDQLLNVLGPGMAGILAVWLGVREIFFIDAVTFVIAGVLILLLPQQATRKPSKPDGYNTNLFCKEIVKGTSLLFSKANLRFALSIEFVSAVAGAMILVNTVGHVKNGLHMDDSAYGWAMSAFGIGATLAALLSTTIDKSKDKTMSLIIGAFLLSFSIAGADWMPYPALLAIWLLAGLGQSMAEMPSEILIGEGVALDQQGKVYGAHFAWSHLWWAIAYPVAGWVGSHYPGKAFLLGGALSLMLVLLVMLIHRLLPG